MKTIIKLKIMNTEVIITSTTNFSGLLVSFRSQLIDAPRFLNLTKKIMLVLQKCLRED